MGVMNLASVPFRGHGAGGLAAQHRFGARTWRLTAIEGAILIAVALFFAAPEAPAPLPICLFGALLLFAALEVGRTPRFSPAASPFWPYSPMSAWPASSVSLSPRRGGARSGSDKMRFYPR